VCEVASEKFGARVETRTGNAEVTAADEGPSDGENLLGKQGYVKGLGDGGGAREHVQDRLVARLDSHDGRGGREDFHVPHKVRSTQVCADSDVLDNTCDW
jgi:hypothetical protein